MSDADKVIKILESQIEQTEKQKKKVTDLLDEISEAPLRLKVQDVLARLNNDINFFLTELGKLKLKRRS